MPAPVTTTLLAASIALALLFPGRAEIAGVVFLVLALLNEAYVFYLLGQTSEDSQ